MNKYEQLSKDLQDAKKCAIEVAIQNREDGGTCNCDTCELHLKGWNYKNLKNAVELAGLRVMKWSTGYYHIYGYENGQANLRTRMVKAFQKVLSSKGYDALVYYVMD